MLGRMLLAAVVAGGVFYGYPIVNEHVSTACEAVEQRFITMASSDVPADGPRTMEMTMMRKLEPISGGAFAAAEAKAHYPQLPPEMGCATTYWASILDPRVRRAIGGQWQ